MRTLTVNEMNTVSGGIAPIAWGTRALIGGAAGGASAVIAEVRGDGLQWSDARFIAISVGTGALFGLAGGGLKRYEDFLKKEKN
jgi:lactobin A/cerein 7B family class IIb bacteriocin